MKIYGNYLFFFFIISVLFLHGQIINIESKRFASDTNGFDGKIDVFFSANQNQILILTFGANVHARYKINRHRILWVADYGYIKAGSTPFVNNGYLHLRYNYRILKNFYFETYTQTQYNMAILLDQRTLGGAGFRWQVLKKEKAGVFCGISYLYEYQQMAQKTIEWYLHRISTYGSFFLRFPWMEITSTVYYQPALIKNLQRFSADAQLEFLPGKKINFIVSFSGFHDESLPPEIPRFIYATRNTLRFWLK